MQSFLAWTRTVRSYRLQGFFVACLVLLGAGAGTAGTFLLLQWKSREADQGASVLLTQTSQLFSQTLQDRKRTLAVLRNSLQAAGSRLSLQEHREILESSSVHIPQLVANGWIEQKTFSGWVRPGSVSPEETGRMVQESLRRSGWRKIFGAASTFTLEVRRDHSLLIFSQPFRASGRASLFISAIDLNACVANLMQSEVRRSFPVQVTEGERVLYQSPDWRVPPPGKLIPVFERTTVYEGIRWRIQMQAGADSPLPGGWVKGFLLLAGLISCLAIAGMIWATGRLRQLATTDELTRLHNRRFFLERWQEEVARAKRYRRQLSCLIMDINGFKRINDRNGHLAGDRALQQVATELQRQLRQTDVLARFGGDEFIVALPETTLDQALEVAKKLRGLDFGGSLTLSVGSAHLLENDLPLDVIDRADQDLYASRQETQTLRVT